MRISIRFNQDEERQFNEMKRATGLSNTTLIKKCIFDNNPQKYYGKDIFADLSSISTSVNLAEYAIKDNNNTVALEQINIIHKGVDALWQSL